MADHQIELPVGGMSCGGCATSVERALARVPGVSAVEVDLAEEKARVTTDGSVDVQGLASAIVRAGYTTTVQDGAAPVDG